MKPELLQILCCPASHQSLSVADPALIQKINARVKEGKVQNRAGLALSEPLDEGLVREDKKWLYPVRMDIPVMLIDEAIPLAEFW